MTDTWWLKHTAEGAVLTEVPVYTWASGWGELVYETENLRADISNPARWRLLVEPKINGDPQYQITTVELPTSPTAPVPVGIRSVSSPGELDLMLRIIRLNTSPARVEPFSSGLLKSRKTPAASRVKVPSREDSYLQGLLRADAFEFARVYRDMAQRRREKRPVGDGEAKLLARLFRDLVLEVTFVRRVRVPVAERIVTEAQGFDIEKVRTLRAPRKET